MLFSISWECFSFYFKIIDWAQTAIKLFLNNNDNQYWILFMPTPFPWYLLVWISSAFLVFAFLPQTLHVWLQSRWISQCRLIRVELAIVLAQLRHRHLASAILSIMEFNTSSRSALGLVSGELFRCNANRDFHRRSTIAGHDQERKDNISYCNKLARYY